LIAAIHWSVSRTPKGATRQDAARYVLVVRHVEILASPWTNGVTWAPGAHAMDSNVNRLAALEKPLRDAGADTMLKLRMTSASREMLIAKPHTAA
jgi:hypothetical protein